jgi:hypothetical protein
MYLALELITDGYFRSLAKREYQDRQVQPGLLAQLVHKVQLVFLVQLVHRVYQELL